MVTTKEKPVVVTQNTMIKESNHTTTKGHKSEDSEVRSKEQRTYKKEKKLTK